MSISDLERRLDDSQREQTRLQTLSGRILQDLARLERQKVDTVAAMRRKAEQEIAVMESKLQREVDDMRSDLTRTETRLRSNNVTVLNAQRELENARRNTDPNSPANRRLRA